MNIVLLSIAMLLGIASLVVKKSVPAIISFIGMMFVLGLYYINLDAKMLGLFQIFIYTGGIMVLMLFGVTIIGLEFKKVAIKPSGAFGALLFFILLSTLFLKGSKNLEMLSVVHVEDVKLFSESFSDYLIIFVLIATSLLYATVKMSKALKAKRRT
jgi:NADH-quinone oxidoreductase subunit J